jgi:hypothetical protein
VSAEEKADIKAGEAVLTYIPLLTCLKIVTPNVHI